MSDAIDTVGIGEGEVVLGTPHWRSTRGNATRKHLVDLGVEQLRRSGVGGVSIRAIAEAASMTSAAVHYHYRTQEELLREVLLACEREITQRIERAASGLRGLRRTAAFAREWLGVAEFRPILAEASSLSAPGSAHDTTRSVILAMLKRAMVVTRTSFVQARSLGELREGVDPGAVTLELHALLWSPAWASDLFGMQRIAAVLLGRVWALLAGVALNPSEVLPPRADFVGVLDAAAPDDEDDGFVPTEPRTGRVCLWFDLLSRTDPQFYAFLRHARMGDVRPAHESPPVLPEDVARAEAYVKAHPEVLARERASLEEYRQWLDSRGEPER